MLQIPKKYSHLIYGLVQSGLTCAVASGISDYAFFNGPSLLSHWLKSWLISWVMILPVVLLAAPYIRTIAEFLTCDDIRFDLKDRAVHNENSSISSAEANPGE
jgi:Protein of unknown function (DUF2798)